jgi:hypothetical protein
LVDDANIRTLGGIKKCRHLFFIFGVGQKAGDQENESQKEAEDGKDHFSVHARKFNDFLGLAHNGENPEG